MILESFPVGPLRCNCIILGDEVTREAVVVDPGDNIAEILSRLQKHGLTLRQIVITHAHIDHVGGAALLKKATGAPVFLNQNDLGLLSAMEMQAGWLGIPTPEVAVSGCECRRWPDRRPRDPPGRSDPHPGTHARQHLSPVPATTAAACRRYSLCRIDRQNRSSWG